MASKIDSKYYEELFIFIPFISSFFIYVSTIIYPLLLPKLVGLNLLIGSFIGSFSGSRTKFFTGSFTGTFTGFFTGSFTGLTVQSSTENVSSAKLWVRVA